MAGVNFASFTLSATPAVTDFAVGYATAVAGGERRWAIGDMLDLYSSRTATLTNKTISGASNTITNISLTASVTGTLPVGNGGTGAISLTSTALLLGAGTSAITPADLTYVSPTLTVPDTFVVSSAGSIGLTAGGTAKNIAFTPSTTGFVTITKNNGSPQLFLMASGVAAPQTASLDFRSTGDNSLNIVTNYTSGTTNQIIISPATNNVARFMQSGSVLIGTTTDNGSRLTTARTASATATLATGYLTLGSTENLLNSYRLMWLGYNNGTTYSPAYFGYQEMTNSGNTQGDLVWGVRGVTTDTQPTELMRLKSTGLIINGTATAKFGATGNATIGVSADTTGGIMQFISPTSGTMTFTTANALSATLSGGAAATLTGGAGNMTITAGTGNSRTLTLQTTTSGGTATNALVLGADQSATITGRLVETPSALTYASPTSVNVALASVYTVTTVNATGSVTFNASAGGTAGQQMTILITNDATSAKTITFGTNFLSTGTLTASAASRHTSITFCSDGTNWYETGRAILSA